jgi:hypothetical protein
MNTDPSVQIEKKRRGPAAYTRLQPGMVISPAKVRFSTSTMLSDVPVVQLKIARKWHVRQRGVRQRYGIGRAFGWDHHFADRRQRGEVVDVDGVGALAARAARVVGRRQVDLGAARRKQRHHRSVPAVQQPEEAPRVDVDQRRALQDEVGDPHPVGVRRQRQLLDLPSGLRRQVGARGRGRERGGRQDQDQRQDSQGLQRISPIASVRAPFLARRRRGGQLPARLS